jgi:hypothetical protein
MPPCVIGIENVAHVVQRNDTRHHTATYLKKRRNLSLLSERKVVQEIPELGERHRAADRSPDTPAPPCVRVLQLGN